MTAALIIAATFVLVGLVGCWAGVRIAMGLERAEVEPSAEPPKPRRTTEAEALKRLGWTLDTAKGWWDAGRVTGKQIAARVDPPDPLSLRSWRKLRNDDLLLTLNDGSRWSGDCASWSEVDNGRDSGELWQRLSHHQDQIEAGLHDDKEELADREARREAHRQSRQWVETDETGSPAVYEFGARGKRQVDATEALDRRHFTEPIASAITQAALNANLYAGHLERERQQWETERRRVEAIEGQRNGYTSGRIYLDEDKPLTEPRRMVQWNSPEELEALMQDPEVARAMKGDGE